MTFDLTELDDRSAGQLVMQLIGQLEEARNTAEAAHRRMAGIRLMLDGIVEIFPATEDLLPDDLDADKPPHPRGSMAVRDVLNDNQMVWYTVNRVASELSRRGWMPNSATPANAVRSALERLVAAGLAEKGRDENNAIAYRIPFEDEEPF